MTDSNKEIATVSAERDCAKKELNAIPEFVFELHEKVLGHLPNKKQTVIDVIKDIYFFIDNIIAATPSSVYWLDTHNVYLGCNNEHAKGIGLTRESIVGKTNFDLPWHDSADALNQVNNEVIKRNEKILIEESGLTASGELRTVLTEKAPLYDRAGKIAGVIGSSIDITERKKAEQLAKEKEIMAEKLALTEAFTGFMAHELRTPVAILNTVLDTIEGNEKVQDAVKRQKNLYQIIAKGKQTVKEANSFIEMLLLKLRSMGKPIKKEDLNLCLILEDVSDALVLYPFTEEERTQVTWDKKDAFVYLGDGLHTQHIILNLLKNALKIIREENKGKINISFEQGEDYNKLIFVDTAKGMVPEFLPTIFDAFVTKDETKKGTGLGLAYCKMIMLDYGGDIACESKLGEYTKFILTFPKANMEEI